MQVIKSSDLYGPRMTLAAYAQGGGTAQNSSDQPRAIPNIPAVLFLPTATSPGTLGFAVSLSPAQILLKTLPFHFSERCSANLFLPTSRSKWCLWVGWGWRALPTGSDYPAP